MKVSEWLAIAGLVVSIALAGVAGWVQLAARLSSMEEHQRGYEKVFAVLRERVIHNMTDVQVLKGMHTEHKHTGAVIGDEPVMAQSYLSESEM